MMQLHWQLSSSEGTTKLFELNFQRRSIQKCSNMFAKGPCAMQPVDSRLNCPQCENCCVPSFLLEKKVISYEIWNLWFFPLKGVSPFSHSYWEDLIGFPISGFESPAGSFSGPVLLWVGSRTMPTWALRKNTWTWQGDGEESNPATQTWSHFQDNWWLWSSWMVTLKDFKPFVGRGRNTTSKRYFLTWAVSCRREGVNNCLGCLPCDGRNQRIRGRRECTCFSGLDPDSWSKRRSKVWKDYNILQLQYRLISIEDNLE